MHRNATWRIVAARAGSDSSAAQGACSLTYRLTLVASCMASPSAALNRACSMSCPIGAKPASTSASSALSSSVRRPGPGNLAEVPVRARQHAVDEIPPVREQLVVVPADELRPREVRVLRLRACGREVVAERVRRVTVEHLADVDDDVAARRELVPLHRQELARHDVVGQLELSAPSADLATFAVPHQLARPDNAVEDDVVLPHEVVVPRVGALPPLAPRIRCPAVGGPLDRGGQVADHGVDPDIDPLVVSLLEPRHRDAHSPVEVARHRSAAKLPDELQREASDVRTPVILPLDPAREPLRERGQVEEQVGCLPEDRWLAVDLRAWLDEVGGVELITAVVALVAARLGKAADRAGPLDVPVGKRAARRRRERADRRLLDDRASFPQRAKDVAHDGVVIRRGRPREEVVREPQPAKIVADDLAVPVDELAGGYALSVGRDHDRSAVLVGAAHHEHVAAL